MAEDRGVAVIEAASLTLKDRKVGWGLGVGIVVMPYVFSWFTLRRGHTQFARIAAFAYLGVFVLANIMTPPKGADAGNEVKPLAEPRHGQEITASESADGTGSAGSALNPASASEGAFVPPPPAAPKTQVVFNDKNERTLCRNLTDAFTFGSKRTELQMDNAFESMKDQLFQYEVSVTSVEVTFGSLTLSASCATKANEFATGDFILSASKRFKPQLAQLSKGDVMTVCGRFTHYTRYTGLHGDLVALGPCPDSMLIDSSP